MEKFKPFPRTINPDTGKKIVDVPELKRLYLDGDEITFQSFCARHGFNPKASRHQWNEDVDIAAWRKEWIKTKCEFQDEDAAPELLRARGLIAKSRARFITDWNERARIMKQMLDFMLKKHMSDMMYDITHALEIQAGRKQRKCRLDAKELNTLASTALKLMDLEAKSLLLMPVKLQADEVNAATASDDEAEPEMEFQTMGAAGLSSAEITSLIAAYFDQQ
jgi:hypothetical protein